MIILREYLCVDGSSPFASWFEGLDTQAALKVNTYLTRIGGGNFSTVKGVGSGVYECRINWASGSWQLHLDFPLSDKVLYL